MDHFYCNINALTPAERAHHKKLTETLMTKIKKVVETEQGYEFHSGDRLSPHPFYSSREDKKERTA